jgi:hypothetical protein
MNSIGKRLCTWLPVALGVLSGQLLKAGTVYVDIAENWPYMVGVGITSSDYAMSGTHTAYATVTVTSPSGRSATNTGSEIGSVTVYTYLSLGDEDGNFTAANEGREYCPVVGVSFSDGTQYTGTAIPPYMYVSGASVTPASLRRQGDDSGRFRVEAAKSPNCTASSVDLAVIIFPNPSDLQVDRPAQDHVLASFVYNAASATFSFGTMNTNTKPGTIRLDGIINNPGCDLKGIQKSASVTVQ